MKLEVVKPSAAAAAFGLLPDAEGLPARGAIASALRKYVGTRGAVETTELVSWLTTLCAAVGYPASPARDRIESVLKLLVAAGDTAFFSTAAGNVIVAAGRREVRVGPGVDLLLGCPYDEPDLAEDSAEQVLRHCATAPDSLKLRAFLGEPSYKNILSRLEIPRDVTLEQALPLLTDIARMSGRPFDPATNVRPLFRLPDSNCTVVLIEGETGALAAVVASAEGGEVSMLELGKPADAGWLWLASCGRDGIGSQWLEQVEMPPQLLRAFAVTGRATNDSLTKWDFSIEGRAQLLEWLGYHAVDDTAHPIDSAQNDVIFAPARERLLVEAGPGSGKTWTLCRRVAHLIDEGMPPTRVLVISFTRAAVSEIRERISDALQDEAAAAAVSIITLDSLAWKLRVGFSAEGEKKPSTFDENVAETLALLGSGDDDLLDYIGSIEHLLVDEAQDLTGPRRDLVITILQKLGGAHGATVFHDPAQAIYGFTSGSGSGIEEALLTSETTFREISLVGNYRTQSASLRSLFADGRRTLRSADLSSLGKYEQLRSEVESAGSAVLGPVRQQEVDASDGRTFFLFRARGEVTAAASELLRSARSFRMRLSRNREIVQPWIGALFGRSTGATCDRRSFDGLWEEARPLPARSSDILWASLLRAAGTNGQLDLNRLAARMAVGSSPAELVQTDIGTSGPLLATIHSAKGREADTVHLMLPRYSVDTSGIDWDEEARILFVGATRGRNTLRIGSAANWLRPLNGTGTRLWQHWRRRGRQDAQVEVGLEGDVDDLAMIDESWWGGASAINDVQALLWRLSRKATELQAVRSGDIYTLEVKGGRHDGQKVGRLARNFTSDLWRLSEAVSGTRQPPPGRIGGIFLVAARTVAMTTPGESTSRFWLAPVILGLPVIYLDRSR